ncbi:SMI1/KNR4 family protein [Leptolyngbya sp. FACHB-36]|uniref:SMI1/KNR4 family protein n=1 Tax=Leptolyngbya sp. FACHB-36 TaxID=2692808 RepID=UPI001681813B|nr:SMI1/KNR4 family protein [Leptolyngbya sp. FACHB-36]MBD2019532.1 SMI1/KNR4 family protein [Leptolyngbya sp. FACHB-36]
MYLDKAKESFTRLSQISRVSREACPCTLDEVQELENSLGLPLAKAYKEFLLWAGENGGYFSSDRANWQHVRRNREDALEIMQEDGVSEDLLPRDAIVFVVYHGGSRFAFIRASEGDDPPVHEYCETFDSIGIRWNFARNLDEYCVRRIKGSIRALNGD